MGYLEKVYSETIPFELCSSRKIALYSGLFPEMPYQSPNRQINPLWSSVSEAADLLATQSQ